MKTIKRITAVVLLFITFFAVSYFVYTAKKIPSKNAITGVAYEPETTT